jgi:3-hydroxyisobutyrate dehydrogenase
MPPLAFLGLGTMGTPMAHRLVAAGQDVVVWNRTRSRTDLDLAMAVAAPPMSAAAQATVRDAAARNGKADLSSIAHLADDSADRQENP